jgi:hypothetical protein
LLRSDVSEESTPSIVKDIRIGEIRLLVVTNFVPTLPILVTPVIEAIRSFETQVPTTLTWRNIPQEGILHTHHLKTLKSYLALTGWSL